MAKAAEIVSTLAVTLGGYDHKDVMEVSRRLRECPEGYFVRETRSPNSPRATCRHVANLLITLLSDRPAKHAGRTMERYADTRLFNPNDNNIHSYRESLNQNGPLSRLFHEDCSAIDAVECLLEEAKKNQDHFESSFRNTTICVDHFRYDVTVELNRSDKLAHLLGSDNSRISIRLIYSSPIHYHDGDARKETVISARTIAVMGRLLARTDE